MEMIPRPVVRAETGSHRTARLALPHYLGHDPHRGRASTWSLRGCLHNPLSPSLPSTFTPSERPYDVDSGVLGAAVVDSGATGRRRTGVTARTTHMDSEATLVCT